MIKIGRNKPKFYTYILINEKRNRTYTGFSSNIQKRIDEHNKGFVKSTKYLRPFELLHAERFDTSSEAKKRERYFKSKAGRMEIRSIINNFKTN